MKKSVLTLVAVGAIVAAFSLTAFAGDMEVLGVTFPGEKVIEGKTLTLNGVAYRKAMGIVKVYAVGLYLEKPSQDPKEVIESEQVKHLLTHYLTKKATAQKIQEGFLDVITECNPPELVENSRVMGDYLLGRLGELIDLPVVGDVRGKGLFCGVELVRDKASKQPPSEAEMAAVVDSVKAEGVLVGRTNSSLPGLNTTLYYAPALVITQAEADRMVDATRKGIHKVFGSR